MPGIKFKNNAYGTITSSIGAGDVRTSIVINLTSGHGARFPALPASTDFFIFDLINSSAQIERFKAVAISGDTITAIGAQEGTAALPFSPGDRIEARLTNACLNEVERIGQSGGLVTASGSVNALTVSLLTNMLGIVDGMRVRCRAPGANTNTTPTLQLVLDATPFGGVATSTTPRTIVKGNNAAIRIGDIPSSSYICEFDYNANFNAWVFRNPFSGESPASFIPPGSFRHSLSGTIDPGWILGFGGTLGNAGSTATNRAHLDCHDLYVLWWNTTSEAIAPTNGGRGASAEADWLANKWITLPDLRGRVIAGADNMGGTPAGRLTPPYISPDGNQIGATGGAQTHTLTAAEMPAHTHSYSQNADVSQFSSGVGVNNMHSPFSGQTGSSGSGAPHNNVQPTFVGYAFIKL